MKQIILEIGDIQHDVLTQYATKNGLSPEQYATNILVSWLNSHIQGFYIERIQEETFENLEEKLGKFDIEKEKTV